MRTGKIELEINIIPPGSSDAGHRQKALVTGSIIGIKEIGNPERCKGRGHAAGYRYFRNHPPCYRKD
jgi:hypothetical protein